MPGSIRVACASNGGEALHGHVGSARRFLIYQVSAETVRLSDARATNHSGAENKNACRAGLIRQSLMLRLSPPGRFWRGSSNGASSGLGRATADERSTEQTVRRLKKVQMHIGR